MKRKNISGSGVKVVDSIVSDQIGVEVMLELGYRVGELEQ